MEAKNWFVDWMARPSLWAKELKRREGATISYGTRPDGTFLVDLDNDATLWAEHLDPTGKIPVLAIGSLASPAGLYRKMRRGFAHGTYFVVPTRIPDVDIVRSKVLPTISGGKYSAAMAVDSPGTSVPASFVFMDVAQLSAANRSEFKNGNYVVASCEIPLAGESIRALVYQSNGQVFAGEGGPFAFHNLRASNRVFAEATLEGFLEQYSSDGPFTFGTNWEVLLDPYVRDDPGSVVWQDGKPLQREYDGDMFSDFIL